MQTNVSGPLEKQGIVILQMQAKIKALELVLTELAPLCGKEGHAIIASYPQRVREAVANEPKILHSTG